MTDLETIFRVFGEECDESRPFRGAMNGIILSLLVWVPVIIYAIRTAK